MTRKPPPDTRPGTLRRLSVGGSTGHYSVSCYPDGRPCELFVYLDPRDTDHASIAWAEQWAIAVSFALQHGADGAQLFGKFRGARFEPSDMRSASIADAIARGVLESYYPDRGA